MTTTIEKVARAICAAVPGTGDIDEHFSDEFPLARRHWMEMARAAIEAMKRPVTDAMIIAGTRAVDNGQNVSEIFDDMIDAALKEAHS